MDTSATVFVIHQRIVVGHDLLPSKLHFRNGDTDRAIPKDVPKGSKETPSGEKDDNERAMATAKKKMKRRKFELAVLHTPHSL